MRAFWGTALAFVSCVNDHYEDYADYMFGDEADAYAEIIRQADDFHYNVQLHLKELVQDAAAEGVKINVIVEYGIQQYPLSEDSEKLGDYMISVEKQSFGATACNTGETLSDSYIAARTAKRLLGQPLLARRYRFGLLRGPVGRRPLAHVGACELLARRRVRLCTRGTRRCAQADKGGSLQPISCPTLHTPIGGVCTNGHVPSPFAARTSACARSRPSRMRMRTSRRRGR